MKDLDVEFGRMTGLSISQLFDPLGRLDVVMIGQPLFYSGKGICCTG